MNLLFFAEISMNWFIFDSKQSLRTIGDYE
jgi:hypothetical protein